MRCGKVRALGSRMVDSLPDPHILEDEIAEDLRGALAQIEDMWGELQERINH